MQENVSVGARVATYWTSCSLRFASDSELVRKQLLHSAFVHNEQKHVCGRAAYLETVASALNPNSSWRSESTRAVTAAGDEASTVLTTDNKCGLLDAGDNDDTPGLIEEVAGNALIRLVHRFTEGESRILQSLIG